jgi:hypothetical protein
MTAVKPEQIYFHTFRQGILHRRCSFGAGAALWAFEQASLGFFQFDG